MEGTFNLKTASEYINNLLLARGLLRDGKKIQFAHPSRGEGGKEVTMAQIINLVHDLILKRDRDQEQRETVAGTLRTLRSEATRQTLAIEKLQTKNADLTRQVSLAQSQERSARAALRAAESSARSLREEMLRLKTTVQQVRTSCANDVRKREVQIQRLKGHLTTQQRGNKTGLVGASITINPGLTGAGGMTASMRDDAPDVDDPGYSLKQETTEFLTQLSQSLSDENDNLIGLVRTAIGTLKELQGMPDERNEGEDLSAIREEDENTQQGMLHALPTSYEALATELDTLLENLKHLLTNPNFVPLEEVESREEEIIRLRAGWEKMETRLREAFMLMETWRRRMASGGDTINLDELKLGLGLGMGLESVNNEDMSMIAEDEEELEDEEGTSSVFDEEVDGAEDADELQDPPSPDVDPLPEKKAASEIFSLKLQPNPAALKETNGNPKSPARSPRKVAFSASIPNTPSSQVEIENTEASGLDLVGMEKPKRPTSRSEERVSRSTSQDERTPRQVRCDKMVSSICKMASKVTFSSSPSLSPLGSIIDLAPNEDWQANKRLSSPHAHPDEPSPKLTVQDKLKVAQAEAEAAAIAEGSKARTAKKEKDDAAAVGVERERERRQRRPSRSSPMKTRIGGRPKRRKSTLTPEELDNLLGV
ncbi:nima interactive protein [Paraphaeosphaeria sporulosa]